MTNMMNMQMKHTQKIIDITTIVNYMEIVAITTKTMIMMIRIGLTTLMKYLNKILL